MAPKSDLLQGTLDLLILRTLTGEPMHGWGISQRIQQLSKDALQVNQGSRPRAAPARAAGTDRGGMGQLGKQPAGEVLPADARGPEGARRRAEELGAPVQRGRAGPRRILTLRTGFTMFRRLSIRLQSLFRRELEGELDQELGYHIDMLTEQNIARHAAGAGAP